jgi:hypothetical protein
MDHQVPQASTDESDRNPGKGSGENDLREPGRRDSEGEHKSGSCPFIGECTADVGGVQARAAHEGADIMEAVGREQRVE